LPHRQTDKDELHRLKPESGERHVEKDAARAESDGGEPYRAVAPGRLILVIEARNREEPEGRWIAEAHEPQRQQPPRAKIKDAGRADDGVARRADRE
jgi:hypothetical protein